MLTGFDALGADFLAMTVEESGPLEVGLLATFDCWIIFGGADTVGIAADDSAGFFAN